MTSFTSILYKFELVNQYHLGYILLFSYLTIPLHLGKVLAFRTTLALGYGTPANLVLLLVLCGTAYTKRLDSVCRKTLSMALLIFTSVFVTCALFIRYFTSVFVLGSLIYIVLVWLEAALLTWICEITLYRNVFVAIRSIHVIAIEVLLAAFGITVQNDGAFIGMIVVVALSMGFCLIFIPASPVFHLEVDQVGKAREEAMKLCVLHEVAPHIATTLSKTQVSKSVLLRRLDRMILIVMILASLMAFPSSLSADTTVYGTTVYRSSAKIHHVLSDGQKLLSGLHIILVLLQGTLLGLLQPSEVRHLLQCFTVGHFTLTSALLLLTALPDEPPSVFVKELIITVSVLGTLVKHLVKQTVLYYAIRSLPPSTKVSVLSVVLGVSTLVDNISDTAGGSFWVLANALVMGLTIMPNMSAWNSRVGGSGVISRRSAKFLVTYFE